MIHCFLLSSLFLVIFQFLAKNHSLALGLKKKKEKKNALRRHSRLWALQFVPGLYPRCRDSARISTMLFGLRLLICKLYRLG